MSRCTLTTHKGKLVLHIGFDGTRPGGYGAIIDEATKIVRSYPLGSLRVVTSVADCRFDPPTIAEFERFIRETSPHVYANAVVGVEGLRKVAWLGLKAFYRSRAELFPTVEAGKDWLASV